MISYASAPIYLPLAPAAPTYCHSWPVCTAAPRLELFPEMTNRFFSADRARSARAWAVRIGALFAGLYIYGLASERAGGMGAGDFWWQFTELVLLAGLYAWFYAILRPVRGRAWLAAIPLLLLYVVQDAVFIGMGKVFRAVEAQELPELLRILPAPHAVGVAAALFVPLGLFLAFVNWRRPRPILAGLVPVALFVAALEFAPQVYSGYLERFGNQIYIFSDRISVQSNGRLAMMLYHEAQRVIANRTALPYRNRAEYDHDSATFAADLARHSNQRNVHLVVMESFLDPTLFRDLKFSRDPVHPDFRKLFGNKVSLSVSPVFGGATAQAEFEVLCGVPALEKLSSIEFNVFSGAPARCLPDILAQAGYRTVASNAYKPDFFNEEQAYRGVGFGESFFPREFNGGRESYLSVAAAGKEEYLFDGDLFEQNLAFVAAALKEPGHKPLFNYVMTIYGHTPHPLDPERRPAIIDLVASHQDEHLRLVVNQFYYRTQAVAHYLRELRRIDPDSLVIVVSDHVPPLNYGPNTYKALAYMGNVEGSYYFNRALVLENGKPRAYTTLHHYDMPELIYNYMTNGHYCRAHECEFRKAGTVRDRLAHLKRYFALMAHASE